MGAIDEYNDSQEQDAKEVCDILRSLIAEGLPESNSKLYHGGPVWFIDDNPVVGYWVRKTGVQLLFWSGQSFNEPGLSAEGKFKAAEKIYLNASEIDETELAVWLSKARDIQWDYKNIVKRKGELIRLR